jgi:hypothetical protein
MDEFKIVNEITMGNYDTIEQGQFTRRGSRQLKTWQFDSLVMEIGLNQIGPLSGLHDSPPSVAGTRQVPGWVPFPKFDAPGVPSALHWYIDQIQALHDAGCPFMFTAQFQTETSLLSQAATSFGPLISLPAVLLGFTEGHKHGEGDAIYIEGISFSEWRDPTTSQKALGQGGGHAADAPPTAVILYRSGTVTSTNGTVIPVQPKGKTKQTTLNDLAKFFYHDTSAWRDIANANGLTGGAGSTSMLKFPKYKKIPANGVKVKIPTQSLSVVGTALLGSARSLVGA